MSFIEKMAGDALERERQGWSEVTVIRDEAGVPWYIDERLLYAVDAESLLEAMRRDT